MRIKFIFGGFILAGILAAVFFIYPRGPKISVMMATYNRADMLPGAIDSILTQTLGDFEFIIINDGSSDQTDQIIRDYARLDKRIVYIKNVRNLGLVDSLNKGLNAARGKYIARMDDDDISTPQRLRVQYEFMEKHPDIDVVGGRVQRLYSDILDDYPFEVDPNVYKILPYLKRTPLAHSAAFIRSDFLKKNKILYDRNFVHVEDKKFWLDIMDAGGKISSVSEMVLMYRFHRTNPASYYSIQKMMIDVFYVQLFDRFGAGTALNAMDFCGRGMILIARNKEKNLVDQALLEKMVGERCAGE
ncbi:MAG: glycosyltransferase family 2 protein [Lactobacillales bacterium]|nr:glycosyltransferase family 2 protein [Lactobacillales bacterium]